MTTEPDNIPPLPTAPPTIPGLIPPGSSAWPTVIGIIAIVFGALGVLQNAAGAVATFAMGMFAGVAGPGGTMMKGMRQYQPWLLLQSAAGALIAGLLIAGGISLNNRGRRSVATLRLWAITKILLVPIGAAVGYFVQQAQFQAMSQDPAFASNPSSSMTASMMGPMALVGAAFGLVWGWALPIFMLIWFSRPKVRSETADWR